MPDEGLGLRPRHRRCVLVLIAAEASRHQAPDPGAKPWVDAGDPPLTRVTDELAVARFDQACGIDVNHAATRHVRAQQHVTRPAFKLPQVELGRRSARALRLEALDPVRGHKQLTTADPDLQPL